MVAETARKDVLVIEPLDFYRRLTTELLRAQGYRVDATEDAAGGLARLARDHYDLVLLDSRLPPSGAAEFLERVADRGRSVKAVLLLPATGEEVDWPRMHALGVGSTVERGAPIDDIAAAARRALFPQAKDLRRSPRAQIRLPVAFAVDGATSEVITSTFNVSADGMFLVATATEPAAPGSSLALRFWVPTTSYVIESEAVVVWCNRAGDRVNELYPPGMGIMYIGLDPSAARAIDSYVRRHADSG